MIDCNIILKKLRDDLCATIPKDERAFVRKLLTSYIPSSIPSDAELRALQQLEHDVTHAVFAVCATTMGSILFFSRFLRKLDRGGASDPDRVISQFHARQQSLRNPSWSEDTLVLAQSWGALVFGSELPAVNLCSDMGPAR